LANHLQILDVEEASNIGKLKDEENRKNLFTSPIGIGGTGQAGHW
jgi:hypothetical protein